MHTSSSDYQCLFKVWLRFNAVKSIVGPRVSTSECFTLLASKRKGFGWYLGMNAMSLQSAYGEILTPT